MWDTPIPGILPAAIVLGVILFVLAYSFRDRTRPRRHDGESGDPAWLEYGDTNESSWGGGDDGGSCDGGDGGGGDGGSCD